jgi:D-beta-D-heptose 7-phosphate kinase/D-beta-D-heptose 1-phosphate adenosyltransferase
MSPSAAAHPTELWHLVPRLHGRRVLVVGDVMLDRFVYGRMERISPEAPVPILRHVREGRMLGGAGNVASNLRSLGGVPLLLGLIGCDAEGELVRKLCLEAGIAADGLVADRARATSLKTRFIAQGQQVLRYDREDCGPVDEATRTALLARFDAALDEAETVVLSDYGKGTLSGEVAAGLIARARARGRIVIVDPKGTDYARYRGASLVTPNLKELGDAVGTRPETEGELVEAARGLVERFELGRILVTRSAEGMSLIGIDEAEHIPAKAREVFDVSGAGDTVVSALALALAEGIGPLDAARIANAAAGIVVGKRGTAASLAASWREQGLKVGFTNGCFDIIHAGHVALAEQARASCDKLIVAVNSDASVRRLKGLDRPINPEAARASVLAALGAVDLVVVFDEDTPQALIETIQPDVLVKGADYAIEAVVGAEFVLARGGIVKLVDLLPGHSTTRTVAAIRTASASS